MKRQRGLKLGPGGTLSVRRKPSRTSGRLSTMDEELASQILRDIPKEMKFLDLSFGTPSSLANTWVIRDPAGTDSLSGVAVGDTGSTRDGRVYHIFSLNINFVLKVDRSEATSLPKKDYIVRILVVLDQQTSGVQLTPTTVMTAGSPSDWMGFKDLRNESRFRILYDRVFTLSPRILNEGMIDSFAAGELQRAVQIKLSFANVPIKVVCTGTDNTISSIADNSLHMVCTATSSDVKLGYTSRMTFKG